MVQKKRISKRKTTIQRVKIQRSLTKKNRQTRRNVRKETVPATILKTDKELKIIKENKENILMANVIKKNCKCEDYNKCDHELKFIDVGISYSGEKYFDKDVDYNLYLDDNTNNIMQVSSFGKDINTENKIFNLFEIIKEINTISTPSEIQTSIDNFINILKLDIHNNKLCKNYFVENLNVKIKDNRLQSIQYLVKLNKINKISANLIKNLISNLLKNFSKTEILLKFKIADFSDVESFVEVYSESRNCKVYNEIDKTYISRKFIERFCEEIKGGNVKWLYDGFGEYKFF